MLALTSSLDSSTVESRVSSFPETRRTFDALYLHSCNAEHSVLRTIVHRRSEQHIRQCQESHVEQRGHVSFHDDHQVLRVLGRHECEKSVDGLYERANDRGRAVHRQQALGKGKAVGEAIQAAHELGELG